MHPKCGEVFGLLRCIRQMPCPNVSRTHAKFFVGRGELCCLAVFFLFSRGSIYRLSVHLICMGEGSVYVSICLLSSNKCFATSVRMFGNGHSICVVWLEKTLESNDTEYFAQFKVSRCTSYLA